MGLDNIIVELDSSLAVNWLKKMKMLNFVLGGFLGKVSFDH